jgi:hypothetical protein
MGHGGQTVYAKVMGKRRLALAPLGPLGRQQRATAVLGATPTWVLGLEFGGVALVSHQAVVVMQLFAGLDIAQGLDEDAPPHFVSLTVAIARMVDPFG